MTENLNKYQASIILIFTAGVIMLLALIIGGCAETLTGDQNANQKPIVNFVNVPPGPTFDTVSTSPLVIDTSYTKFSRNPFVFWYATDADGQIDYFRYVIVTELEMGNSSPDAFVSVITADPGRWIYLDVSVEEGDPHTTEIVSLEALTEDPVNRYLVQYIFVQAFDEEGLGSDVAYRAFSRNDSPPTTSIGFFGDKDFINSVDVGIVTGVSLTWRANDPDYPAGTNAPPFEFTWNFFGPYTEAELDYINDNFIYTVFVTEDAKVYRDGDTIIACDTSFETGGEITCDSFVVGIDNLDKVRGRVKPFLDLDIMAADPSYDPLKLIVSSNGWTNDSNMTLYNVYRNYSAPSASADTTVRMSFIFWVKSRDDANVEDLVPSFKTLNVIDPKFERAVMVIDFTKLVGPLNNPSSPEGEFIKGQRLIWKDLVDGWGYANVPGWDDNSFDINLNDAKSKAPDYLVGGKFPDLPVVELLKHKIVVMYNDDVYVPNLTSYKGVYAAIDAGVNVWLTMRAPVFGALGPVDICESSLPPAVGNYGFYFAASSYSYSGWFRHYFTLDEQKDWYSLPMRVEHFIGANSLESTKWPNLPIDTALLHERYNWNRPGLGLLWIPEVAALPEVNWMAFRARFFQSGFVVSAEPMYLFNSSYGVDHPGDVGDACLSGYDGSPVAHRVQGSYFRTVHFSFTPLAIQPDSMQIITDTVFNYLYEPDQNAPLTKKNIYRYENLSIGQR